MKTFQQFNEDARSTGASFRDGVNKGFTAQMDAVSRMRRGTTDFIKGFVAKKAGSKPGHPQHVGQQVRSAGDKAASYAHQQVQNVHKKRSRELRQAAGATADFIKGFVTGK